jgi:hypothetical protein
MYVWLSPKIPSENVDRRFQCHWYNTILLNIEEKIDDINDNFYKELECMFD